MPDNNGRVPAGPWDGPSIPPRGYGRVDWSRLKWFPSVSMHVA